MILTRSWSRQQSENIGTQRYEIIYFKAHFVFSNRKFYNIEEFENNMCGCQSLTLKYGYNSKQQLLKS